MSNVELTKLTSDEDFKWYRAKLDLERRTQHVHQGTPNTYPCKVSSRLDPQTDYSSSLGAKDIYTHYFIYQEHKVCPKCGHKSMEWPSDQIEAMMEQNE